MQVPENAKQLQASRDGIFVMSWDGTIYRLVDEARSADPSTAAAIGFALTALGSSAVIGIQIGTARHFRVPPMFGLLFPLAYTVIAALAWHSFALRRAGRVTLVERGHDAQRGVALHLELGPELAHLRAHGRVLDERFAEGQVGQLDVQVTVEVDFAIAG